MPVNSMSLRHLAFALAIPAAIPSVACLPEFPATIIGSSDKDLLAAPPGDFRAQIAHLAPAGIAFKAMPPKRNGEIQPLSEFGAAQSDEADLRDLTQALSDARMPPAQRSALLSQVMDWHASARKGHNPALPAGLPPEFDRYARGAACYHAKDLPNARAQWESLLALPAQERPRRTVWALYMLGRTWSNADPAKAADYFSRARAAAGQGFADSLGLAAASLGWEALARWTLGDVGKAVSLYLEQYATGDPGAAFSLRDLAAETLKAGDARLAIAAADPLARAVITAYLISNTSNSYDARVPEAELPATIHHWLELVKARHPADLRGADVLAWAAYRADDMAAANEWLSIAEEQPHPSALAAWIRAKLQMRSGNVEKAMASLAIAAQGFPKNEEWNDAAGLATSDTPWRPASHAAAELALLKLGRAQFTGALDLFYRNGFWQDAAYLAERILTPDELKIYIDRNFPLDTPGPIRPGPYDGNAAQTAAPAAIRELLARRLTRLGRWKEARLYFTPDTQKLLDRYVAGIREGHDPKRPADQRAAALWSAAKIAREQGMLLLATETGPDWAWVSGDFELDDLTTDRLAAATQPGHTFAPVSTKERLRIADSDVAPERRWHYRYIALDHAWAAAQLLPDNSESLARLLIQAGNWVKGSDPQSADRFYKALVTRCPGTALGRQAAQMHWFPPI